MSIDLPAALPPQLVDADRIMAFAADAAAYSRRIDGYEIRITGEHHLDLRELDGLFQTAKTPSQVIVALNATIARKGHLMVTVWYAPDGNTIHVHALQAQVAAIRGGADVAPYFESLQGDPDPRRSEFDRARVLASVRSERSGVDYSASYQLDPADPARAILVFTERAKPDYDATDWLLQVGNQGSRFVGRDFVDAGVTHRFRSGSSVSFGFETALSNVDTAVRDGDDYRQFQLKLDHPFTTGLYGADGTHIEYQQTVHGMDLVRGCRFSGPIPGVCLVPGRVFTDTMIDIEANIDRAGLTAEQVLRSDIDYRLNLFQRLEYVDSQLEVTRGPVVQDERYGALELGAKYNGLSNVLERSLNWSLTLSAKAGLGGDRGTLGSDETAPGIAIGKRTAEFAVLRPVASARWSLSKHNSLGIESSGQFGNEQLPQQQQWVLGGTSSLSAYLPGVLVGDSGYYGKVDYRYQREFSGMTFTASLFAEHGAARYENAGDVAGETAAVSDAGMRLRLEFGEGLDIQAVAARSIADDKVDKQVLEDAEADFFLVVKATL